MEDKRKANLKWKILMIRMGRGSSIGIKIAMDARSGFGSSIPDEGWKFFSSPPCPDRLWGPSSLLSNGYGGGGWALSQG
jgi:hypothetical protein